MWSWAVREQRLSFDRVSSVDDERGSGRESRFVAGQVQHRVGDVFGLPERRDEVVPPHLLHERLVALERDVHARERETGRDGVDADAVRGQLDRECAGHADDGGLRGGVGGQVRQADVGEVGAGVDDCATALLDHLAGGVLDRK